MAKTVRKQFYLSQDLSGLLTEFANSKRIAEAEVIRRALIEYLLQEYSLPKDEPLATLAGRAASGRRVAEVKND